MEKASAEPFVDASTKPVVDKTPPSTVRLVSVLLLAVLGLTLGIGAVAQAASINYKDGVMNGNTSYTGYVKNNTGNGIGCASGDLFSASISLHTSGGSVIRVRTGTCPLGNYGHPAENSTRPYCTNKTSLGHYGFCQQQF